MAVRRRENGGTWNLELVWNASTVVPRFGSFVSSFSQRQHFSVFTNSLLFSWKNIVFLILDANYGRLPDISIQNSKLQGNLGVDTRQR